MSTASGTVPVAAPGGGAQPGQNYASQYLELPNSLTLTVAVPAANAATLLGGRLKRMDLLRGLLPAASNCGTVRSVSLRVRTVPLQFIEA